MNRSWTFEEILALDLLTLSEHTVAAGDEFDAATHGMRLKPSLEKSSVLVVRRDGQLVAYASLWQKSKELWFVSGFNTHPDYRNGGVIRELMRKLIILVGKYKVQTLQSNVYKTNKLSMAFHKKLGFEITLENDKGVEFTGIVAEMLASKI